MTISLQSTTAARSQVWITPICYAAGALVLQFLLLAAFDVSVLLHQQFTAVVNITSILTVFSACFWAALRLMHRRANSAMLAYLLDENSLSHFAFYRKRARVRLRNQAVLSVTLAVACVLWLREAHAPSSLAQWYQLIITTTFWFFGWLYFIQGVSLPRFLRRHFLTRLPDSIEAIKRQQKVTGVVRYVLFTALAILLLLPVTGLAGAEHEWIGVAVSISLGLMVLFALNVLWGAAQKARAFQLQAIERIDKKLYFLGRQSKYRKDALEHAITRLQNEKVLIASFQANPVSSRLIALLLIWCTVLPLLWLLSSH